ncbi:Spo0E family sporulation regulatory protein-aspartic acid phosphatase [Ectobacillus funiculus]|uniref:Spo0E family sporulation regulatory protein-aspartic acid phosphatase n=1 Tax=Ectobacillus funiculus TaxID=137993 RepID=UPI0039790C7D
MILRNALALRESINEYRESMHEVAKKKGISDPSVIQISKQLDGKIICCKKLCLILILQLYQKSSLIITMGQA